MSCRQAQAWIDEALDGVGLSRERQAHLDAHLAACPVCRNQWQALATAEQALRAPRPVTPPADMLADFRARLAAEDKPATVRGRPARPWGWLWTFAPIAAAG